MEIGKIDREDRERKDYAVALLQWQFFISSSYTSGHHCRVMRVAKGGTPPQFFLNLTSYIKPNLNDNNIRIVMIVSHVGQKGAYPPSRAPVCYSFH